MTKTASFSRPLGHKSTTLRSSRLPLENVATFKNIRSPNLFRVKESKAKRTVQKYAPVLQGGFEKRPSFLEIPRKSLRLKSSPSVFSLVFDAAAGVRREEREKQLHINNFGEPCRSPFTANGEFDSRRSAGTGNLFFSCKRAISRTCLRD